MTKGRPFLLVAAAGLMSCMAQSASHPRPISVKEARNLVLEALPLEVRQLPKFGIDLFEDARFPQFYVFLASSAGAPSGSAVIGYYAVDKSTGDVWNAPAACDELRSASLRKLQAKVRSEIGLSESEYQRIRRKGPLCE